MNVIRSNIVFVYIFINVSLPCDILIFEIYLYPHIYVISYPYFTKYLGFLSKQKLVFK